MSFRNLSPQGMFERLAHDHRPECGFGTRAEGDVAAWKTRTLPRVLATLGEAPQRVPLNPRLLAQWEHDGLHKQKWLIDVQEYLSAVLLLNVPLGLREGERRPAILCWHGHGPFGKEPVMGNDSSPELREEIRRHNYDYGHQMARKGFVTFAVDWIGRGDHDEGKKPNWKAQGGDQDWCNIYYLHATMLGMTPLSINVSHGQAATDFARDLPMVDPDRLGVMGLSGGGTMALWSALCDERFKAIEIICYSDLWAHFGIRDLNYCGMQVAPGLFKLVDLPDLQGLLVPRPLLVDIGVYDTCFRVETALVCFEQVKAIYAAAAAFDRLELDLFAGEHAWSGRKAEAFFRRYLGE